jgi:integrase
MAKMIRQRILVNGQPHWFSGKTQQAIVDRAIERHMMGHLDHSSKDIPIFADYVEEWFQCYKQPQLRPSTYSTYRYLLGKHILPFFGERQLNQIDTAMIQRFYTTKVHLAHSTVNQMGIVLKQVFDSAKEDSYILNNPTDSKRLAISQRKSVREALSAEAFNHISCSLCNLHRQDCLLVAILMFTGIRRGEALGLCWGDIDEANQLIHIRRSVTFQNNQPIIGTPKSAAGVRIVPLGIQLLSILQPHSAEGYIIGNGITPMTESFFNGHGRGLRIPLICMARHHMFCGILISPWHQPSSI